MSGLPREIRIRVGSRPYPVLLGEGLLARAGDLIRERLGVSDVVVVADRRVAGLHGRALRRSLRGAGLGLRLWIDLPPGERAKTLTGARRLYRAFADARLDGSTPVVVLGGGAAGDAAGFAASTYRRGVPVVHVPTSVVAQVDSSVGGKTGVNFASVKNLIGTFHQPCLVLSDPGLLATLPERDYRAGLAEAVKIGVTLRPDLLAFLEGEIAAVLERRSEPLVRVVAACVEAKGEVVGRDERDENVRGILNYGHTLGHALEAEARGRLRHGEAVAIGMAAAARIGERMGVTLPEVGARQNALLEGLGLKLRARGADKKAVARNLRLDKKVRARNIRFVLTLQIGGASVWPHIPERLLRDAVRWITS